jgi:pilus assembly protein TadC
MKADDCEISSFMSQFSVSGDAGIGLVASVKMVTDWEKPVSI